MIEDHLDAVVAGHGLRWASCGSAGRWPSRSGGRADGRAPYTRSMAKFDREKKPAKKEHPTGRRVAVDARTGATVWKNDTNIYGTMLAVSAKRGVLLLSPAASATT